ncbi:MAG: sigma 54-interacting transcriptional regulator [Salinisphaera sp.]|jgi:PAS domain S-box-containing protein|nr:sigma 54-interacting transcriptional regulator [Salinisphaera sp.]
MVSNVPTAALELSAILAHSRDHVVIADGEGRVLKASASCASVYGITLQALVGSSVFDLERDGVLSPSITVRVLQTGGECQLMQQTRTGRSVMAEAYPVHENGRIVRVVSFSKDMTDIRMLQLEYELLHRQLAAQDARASHDTDIPELPTCNARMREIAALVRRVAPTDASVLLLGETGVGKTLVASMLHRLGEHRHGVFVEANCGAIPESLFESEMFGYVTGAFSGAARGGKAGLAERADGGTLFLDEIAELPLSLQSKLLRVIQDGRVTRLGSTEPRTVNFRLVAATNQNLEERLADGRFRLDLYHRLNVVPITIPPLRERREDIPLFIQRSLATLNQRYEKQKVLTPECWTDLLNRDWPGNVRELENLIERLYVTSAHDAIQGDGMPESVAQMSTHAEAMDPPPRQTLREAVERAEKISLEQALRVCQSTYEIAEYLGTSQPTIFRKLRKYGLHIAAVRCT